MSGTVSIPNNIPSSNWPFPNFGRLGMPAPPPKPSSSSLIPKGPLHFSTQAGEGGMGVAHEYVDPNGNSYVLKQLKGQHLAELEIAENLLGKQIPNMPRVLEINVEKRTIAYEYAPGIPLTRLTSFLSPKQAAQVALGVAEAIESAHKHGYVHRDVKPENIIVLKQGGEIVRVNLIDIGLMIPEGSTAQLGTMVGTPHTMSPEQVRGEIPTAKMDSWGLAMSMYESYTGKDFYGHNDSSPSGLGKLLNDITGNHISRNNPQFMDMPAPLRNLMADMLHSNPEIRPSATQVIEKLKTIIPQLDETTPFQEFSNNTSTSKPSESNIETFRRAVPINNNEAAPFCAIATKVGFTAGGFAAPLVVATGVVAGLQALGVENKGALALTGIGAGHASYVGLHKLAAGKVLSARAQLSSIGLGVPAGFLASTTYNSSLDAMGVDEASWFRSWAAQTGAAVGGGYGLVAAGLAALPFGAAAVVNELPAMVYPEKTYQSRAAAIDQAKMEMARTWNDENESLAARTTALGFLFLASVPIFDKMPALFIKGDNE